MSKSEKTVDRRKIIKELKGESDADKRNITFALPKDLLEKFKKDCKQHSLSMNRVIQKLVEDYLG